MTETTKYVEIDEVGTYRLKGKAETDHNTIIVEISLNYNTNPKSEVIYNTKNKKRWENFNLELAKMYEETPPETYSKFEQIIQRCMEKTLQ